MRALLLALLPLACTRADLQAIDDIQVNIVDNLLEIRGQVCTDPPAETDFPVKILFIIDGSGSMQFVDNPTYRALADKSGLSAGYLNHLVHGNRPVPSNDVIQTLADSLGVEPEHFREYRLRVITDRLEAMPEMIDRLYKRFA